MAAPLQAHRPWLAALVPAELVPMDWGLPTVRCGSGGVRKRWRGGDHVDGGAEHEQRRGPMLMPNSACYGRAVTAQSGAARRPALGSTLAGAACPPPSLLGLLAHRPGEPSSFGNTVPLRTRGRVTVGRCTATRSATAWTACIRRRSAAATSEEPAAVARDPSRAGGHPGGELPRPGPLPRAAAHVAAAGQAGAQRRGQREINPRAWRAQ